MKSYYVYLILLILLIGFISCNKNTKIIESLSNSVFINDSNDCTNGRISFKNYNEKESTFSADYYQQCGRRNDIVSFKIICPLIGNPKLQVRDSDANINDDIEIVDENTLKVICNNCEGLIFFFKRQTDEYIKKKREEDKQDMKINIAKYVYIDTDEKKVDYSDFGHGLGICIYYSQYIKNLSDYTIDEVIYEYNENNENKRGVEYYISGHGSRYLNSDVSSQNKLQNLKIISVKCKALGIE